MSHAKVSLSARFNAFAVSLTLVFAAVPLSAAEYEWKKDGRANDWDWSDSRNFVLKGSASPGAPSEKDVVYVPDGLTVYARTSDGSFDTASSLERIQPQGKDARIVFEISEGEKTLGAAVNAWTGYVSSSKDKGGFVKTGAGALTLARTGREYYTAIEVREGELRLASKSATYFLEHIAISNGAVFFANPGGYTSAATLNGDGLLTNTVGQVFQLEERGLHSKFGGTIGGKIYFYSSGSIDLCSDGNSMLNFTARNNCGAASSGPVIGISKFGLKTEPTSSVGFYENIFVVDGGYFRYLGTGETTDKTIYFNTSAQAYPSFLDGGLSGGLTFNGALSFAGYNFGMHNMHFTGDHENPCVFNGAIVPPTGKDGFTVGLTKSGKGVWRINNNAYRNAVGEVAVEDGILQFSSIDEAGMSCAFGSGNNYVDYAFLLGSDGEGCEGLMEYWGSGSARVTSRPFGLKGIGGFKASDGPVRIADVQAMEQGGKTLVLDGTGLTNEVQDVSDGDGVVSVVKRGEGTWFMSGDLSFSGTVDVRQGILHVRDPARYRWYRFNIKKLYNKKEANVQSAEGNFMVWVFGLYDKEGNWINQGMSEGGTGMNVLPGEAGNGSLRNVWEKKYEYGSQTYGEVENLFVDSTANSSRFCMRSKDSSGKVLEPDPEDEATWGRVVMRLPDDAPDAVSWDFVQSGYYNWASPFNVVAWSLEGSVDGIRWDELTPTEEARGLWGSSGNGTYNHFWYYGREKYETGSASVHPTGKQIPVARSNPSPCLENVSSVSVARGAVLRADATSDIAIGGLTIAMSAWGPSRTSDSRRLATFTCGM